MALLPTGTVTLLFTDIEGSTNLWEHQLEAMQAALARHDGILRGAIEAYGGHVFKTVGDAFYGVFASAPDALRAAIAAQQALSAERWSEALGQLRVRMALHSGTPAFRDGDYFGPPLNRVARLLSTGHGGQTLLSAATQELVRDHLSPGVTLRDLGEHRLKDLIRPERIFQVDAPNLLADYPPLKTLDYRPNNLPLQPNPFVGREREMEAVRQRLLQPDVRLLTLTGVGGTGKTRLALQVAADLVDSFPAGVWFVNLAPIGDPDLVLSTIATTLGVRDAGGQPLLETLQAYLHAKQLLLLLDNFEQVLPAAGVVADLLATSTGLKVLVTSRAPLRVQAEREFPVPVLALPDPGQLPPLERLTQYDAVRLFIQRAQDVKPNFTVTNANAPAVAEICVRLDGLPLAIELAAVRIKLLPPPALLNRLSNRLNVLTGGARDLPARHQTLRNTIDWSYGLLDASEQVLWRRLAVFVGGCSLDAVESVCSGDDPSGLDILDGLTSLVDKSLLQRVDDDSEELRVSMLETLLEYSAEQLEASGEKDELQRRHAAFYLEVAEQAHVLMQGPDEIQWLDRLSREHPNMRAALAWSLAPGGWPEAALRLCVALNRFWLVRDHVREGRTWIDQALEKGALDEEVRHSPLYAQVLLFASSFDRFLGDVSHDRALVERALEIYREAHDRPGMARALFELGLAAFDEYRFAEAESCFEQSLVLFREAGDLFGTARNLNTLGFEIAFHQGQYERADMLLSEAAALARELEARTFLASTLHRLGYVNRARRDYKRAYAYDHEALEIYRGFGDKRHIVEMLVGLGRTTLAQGEFGQARAFFEEAIRIDRERGDTYHLAFILGAAGLGLGLYIKDYEQADAYLREAVALAREDGNPQIEAEALNNLGWVALDRGATEQAQDYFRECLKGTQGSGVLAFIPNCLIGLARVADLRGQEVVAARLWGAALATAAALSLPLDGQPEYDPVIAQLRERLDAEAFAAARAEGQAMTVEQAIAYAMEQPSISG